MNNLVKYPQEDHEYIINGGILIYDYNKKFGSTLNSLNELNKKMEDSKELIMEREKSVKLGEMIVEMENKNKIIQEKLLDMEKKNMYVREEFLNKEIDMKTRLYNEYDEKIKKKMSKY